MKVLLYPWVAKYPHQDKHGKEYHYGKHNTPKRPFESSVIILITKQFLDFQIALFIKKQQTIQTNINNGKDDKKCSGWERQRNNKTRYYIKQEKKATVTQKTYWQ
jgi:hypothetical protein